MEIGIWGGGGWRREEAGEGEGGRGGGGCSPISAMRPPSASGRSAAPRGRPSFPPRALAGYYSFEGRNAVHCRASRGRRCGSCWICRRAYYRGSTRLLGIDREAPWGNAEICPDGAEGGPQREMSDCRIAEVGMQTKV